MRYLSRLKSKSLSNETVLLRVDLNIDPHEAKYSPRVHSIIPTISFLKKRGAKVVVLSHRGRPGGKRSVHFSLRPFVSILARQSGFRTIFDDFSDFKEVQKKIKHLSSKEILLLENLRFFSGEEKDSNVFAKKLASLGTIYVNDAFGVSHRANASVHAITKLLPSYVGLLLEQEIKHLSGVMKNPRKPLMIIVGGAKVSGKIGLIDYFLKKADLFLVGGAMANTFLKAAKQDIGESMYEPEEVGRARKFLQTGKVITPVDSAWHKNQILDVGPKTRILYAKIIRRAKTVLWNGPLGLIEQQRFAVGTKALIRAVASFGAFSVVGGGETVQLIEKMKMEKKFSFVSTGGGAMLEFLSGKKLPGVEALKKNQ